MTDSERILEAGAGGEKKMSSTTKLDGKVRINGKQLRGESVGKGKEYTTFAVKKKDAGGLRKKMDTEAR